MLFFIFIFLAAYLVFLFLIAGVLYWIAKSSFHKSLKYRFHLLVVGQYPLFSSFLYWSKIWDLEVYGYLNVTRILFCFVLCVPFGIFLYKREGLTLSQGAALLLVFASIYFFVSFFDWNPISVLLGPYPS